MTCDKAGFFWEMKFLLNPENDDLSNDNFYEVGYFDYLVYVELLCSRIGCELMLNLVISFNELLGYWLCILSLNLKNNPHNCSCLGFYFGSYFFLWKEHKNLKILDINDLILWREGSANYVSLITQRPARVHAVIESRRKLGKG